MSNFTKAAIKATFIKQLNEKPYNQITVKSIVEECGINRNTFYYHYQDIPDLIEEIVTEETNRIIQEHSNIETIEDAINAVVDFASGKRKALLHIYNSVNRDTFEQYLWKVCDYAVKSYGNTVLGKRNISEKDREVISVFIRCTCFGFIIEWMNNKMTGDVSDYISRLARLTDGMIDTMISRGEETN